MSALHVYVLCCDAPGCSARFERNLPRADQTRQLAAGAGWVHGVVSGMKKRRNGPSQSLDYCPIHRELGEDLFPKALPRHAQEVRQ